MSQMILSTYYYDYKERIFNNLCYYSTYKYKNETVKNEFKSNFFFVSTERRIFRIEGKYFLVFVIVKSRCELIRFVVHFHL